MKALGSSSLLQTAPHHLTQSGENVFFFSSKTAPPLPASEVSLGLFLALSIAGSWAHTPWCAGCQTACSPATTARQVLWPVQTSELHRSLWATHINSARPWRTTWTTLHSSVVFTALWDAVRQLKSQMASAFKALYSISKWSINYTPVTSCNSSIQSL